MKFIIFFILFLAIAINALRLKDGEAAGDAGDDDYEQQLAELLASLESSGDDAGASRLQTKWGWLKKAWRDVTFQTTVCKRNCRNRYKPYPSKYQACVATC